MVEQLFCKQQVGGSIPFLGFRAEQGFSYRELIYYYSLQLTPARPSPYKLCSICGGPRNHG